MTKAHTALTLIVPVFVALSVLVGCQSQPGDQPGVASTPLDSSKPPVPTESLPTQQFESTPTQPNEKPKEPTYAVPATPVPVRDVQWLVDILRASQVMTITASDANQVQFVGVEVLLDKADRERIVAAVEGHTQTDYGRTERMGPWPPHHAYPSYTLDVATSDGQASIFWSETPYFTVSYPAADPATWMSVEYRQSDSALWKTLEELAPAPRLTPGDIRYLGYATELTGRWGANEKRTTDRAVILTMAAGLSSGVSTEEAAPTEEPKIVLTFVVDGKPYEVKVWELLFTYEGANYKIEIHHEEMIRMMERNGIE